MNHQQPLLEHHPPPVLLPSSNHQQQQQEKEQEHPAHRREQAERKGPIRSVSASSVGGQYNRFRFGCDDDNDDELDGEQDYGSRLLCSEGADMDSADRSFLEFGLATAVNQTVRAATANASTMTNSDSCQDWTGARDSTIN